MDLMFYIPAMLNKLCLWLTTKAICVKVITYQALYLERNKWFQTLWANLKIWTKELARVLFALIQKNDIIKWTFEGGYVWQN